MCSTENVEIVEATWKIPNFQRFISILKENPETLLSSVSRYEFYIGRQHAPTQQPVKLEAFISHKILPLKVPFEGCFSLPPYLADSLSIYRNRVPGSASNSPEFGLSPKLPSCPSSGWRITFCVSDLARLPPYPCAVRARLVTLKILRYEQTTPLAINEFTCSFAPVDLSIGDYEVKLFDLSKAEDHLDMSDGSLNIYFKLEISFSTPPPHPMNFITGDLKPQNQLSKDFASLLLEEPSTADFEIKVSLGGVKKSFHCHKLILATRSPIFRAMFQSDVKEAKENVVEVSDILPKTMEHFLHFLYCGGFQDSSWIQSLPQLVYVSDKYFVMSLMKLCDSHLIECVTSRNALELGKLANLHNLTTATRDIRNFIVENTAEVIEDTVTMNTEVEP